jgi:tetratricopeptide (TPR) repeat protein
MFRSEFDQAEFRYDLARDLNENDTWTLVSSGQGLAFAGRQEQAHSLSDEALLLNNQLSPVEWGYQVGTRFLCGDYAMAVQSADQAGDAIPNLPAWKAASLVYLGREDEAREVGKGFLEKMRAQWAGGSNPGDADVVNWLLESFPIRSGEDRERFRHGVLAATGVSEAGLTNAV